MRRLRGRASRGIGFSGRFRGAAPLFINLPLNKGKGIKGMGLQNLDEVKKGDNIY